jgi:quinol monooxygenase YgiN
MYRVIFEHHPKPDQEEAFIAAWQAGSDIIQEYPGARGTKLFRNLDNPAVLFAMADWESKAAREAAMAEIDKRPDADTVLTAHEQFLDSHTTLLSAELLANSGKE